MPSVSLIRWETPRYYTGDNPNPRNRNWCKFERARVFDVGVEMRRMTIMFIFPCNVRNVEARACTEIARRSRVLATRMCPRAFGLSRVRPNAPLVAETIGSTQSHHHLCLIARGSSKRNNERESLCMRHTAMRTVHLGSVDACDPTVGALFYLVDYVTFLSLLLFSFLLAHARRARRRGPRLIRTTCLVRL